MSQVSQEAMREHQRLQTDLKYFCKRALQIKLKGGGQGPFIWNKAQAYLHSRIEDQLRRTGKVRMFILKGRQQGISTYIAARFYHKVTRAKQLRCFILSHHASTTGTLFQIVDNYHEKCPDPIKPKKVTDNNRQIVFDNDSQYTVGTAGTGSIDRGNTNQFLHWSEVAFSDNVPELLTGVCQTVGDVDGTEKLYESTANGVGNYFHRGCLDALKPDDEYEVVFIPWYWQEEYRAKVPDDFVRTEQEEKLVQAYKLDDQQLMWRRNKINELKKAGHGESKFKQEYPCSMTEAFQSSGASLFDMEKVDFARQSQIKDQHAPLILGVDPAPKNDRTAICWRRGREVLKVETFKEITQMELAGKLALRIDKYNVAKVFIDVAEGRGAVDRLRELGYADTVMGIAFAQKPTDEERYLNKRSEMAGEASEWISDDFGVSIPNNEASENIASADEFAIELGVIPEFGTTSSGRLQLESKKKIKEIYGQSPDLFDAFMLTFAQRVASTYNENNRVRKKFTSKNSSELRTLNRRRKAQPQEDDFGMEPQGIVRVSSNFGRRGR